MLSSSSTLNTPIHVKTQKNTPIPQPASASGARLIEQYESYLKQRIIEQYRKKGAKSQWLLQVGTDSAQMLIQLAALPELADLRFTVATLSKSVMTRSEEHTPELQSRLPLAC